MQKLAFAFAALSLPLLATLASAEEVERYQLEKTDRGYVRLDTATGAMSLCEERDQQLVCRPAADERTAYQDEIDSLSSSLRALEKRVAALEKAPAATELPSEEEFDRSLSYMQRFFRGFMDIVKEYDKDNAPGQKT